MALALVASGCFESAVPRTSSGVDASADAGPEDARAVDATVVGVDASLLWTGDTSDLTCYPIVVHQTFGNFDIAWTQGTGLIADEFFGVLVDPSERAALETFLGRPCRVSVGDSVDFAGKVLCDVFGTYYGSPTRAAYEEICAIEAAFGPHEWVCQQGE